MSRLIDYLQSRAKKPTPLKALSPALPFDGTPGAGQSGLAARALAVMRRGELRDFVAALKEIPADGGYDDWFVIGAAIYNYDPRSLGLAIFKKWSWTAEGYRDEAHQLACESKWAEYERGYEGRPVTVATVYARANENKKASQESISGQGETKVEHANGHTHLPSIFTTPQAKAIHWADLDKDGNPRPTTTNAGVAIRKLEIVCQKDLFHEKLTVGGHAIGEWAGDLTDEVVLMLRKVIKSRYGFDPGINNTRDAAVQLCLEHQFNPLLDYLGGLAWDGVKRIGRWVVDYLGAPDTELNCEFGRLMLVAAVRRIKHPGTKFDQIIVLEGREGTNKSTAIKTLAGELNFSDQNLLASSDREQQEATCGVWLYEIAELAGMKRADIERVKQFASRTEDRARPAWGRFRLDRKRQCIFIGTTNKDSYLLSDTGNRRFWPIPTGYIAIEQLETDRNQLWAEAVAQEAKGKPVTLDPRLWADAGEMQETRRTADSWAAAIGRWLDAKEEKDTSIEDILTGALQIDIGHVDQTAQNRAARCLQDFGWERYQRRVGKGRVWRYRPK